MYHSVNVLVPGQVPGGTVPSPWYQQYRPILFIGSQKPRCFHNSPITFKIHIKKILSSKIPQSLRATNMFWRGGTHGAT